MATLTKTMTNAQIEALYKRIKPLAQKETQPQYTKWQIKTSECTITAYNSGKVVFQGKDVSWLEDSNSDDTRDTGDTGAADKKPAGKSSPKSSSGSSSLSNTYPMAGSDEVGTGDYFGPVTVAAVIVPDEKAAQELKALKITDSKAMTDEYIEKIAPKIKALVPYSIQILPNEAYNRIYNPDTMNANRIKSRMHNQSYINLKNKGYALPDLIVIDQFCTPKRYYSHLAGVQDVIKNIHFETKAESKYIAVAAASVLARAAFLDYYHKQNEKYGFVFEKGAGPKVDANGRKFLKTVPGADLSRVAKLHFANTKRIQS